MHILIKLVALYPILEFVLIHAISEYVKYYALKLIVKLEKKSKKAEIRAEEAKEELIDG